MSHDVPARGGSAPEMPAGAIAVADDAGAELIRRYEERLARDPASLAWAPLADAHRKAGRPRQAIELCREGLRRSPHYHTARLILAKALVDEGDGEAALAELGAALDAGARDAGAHRLAGEIHRRAGRLEPAAAHLAEAVRLDPEDREARLVLDSLRAAGRVPEASPLAGLLADDTFATLAFGALCLEQGLAEEAAQIFLRLLRHDPGNARAREGLDQALRVKTQRRKGP
jgi:tetratricopeptide (TPR) repeat protein